MLYTDEIEKYSIKITEHVESGVNWLDRVINLKLKPLAHGVEPDVFLHFDSYYDHMVGTLVKGNIFDAGIYIGLNPSRFEPIYAALRSEKPVYFTYEVGVEWAILLRRRSALMCHDSQSTPVLSPSARWNVRSRFQA